MAQEKEVSTQTYHIARHRETRQYLAFNTETGYTYPVTNPLAAARSDSFKDAELDLKHMLHVSNTGLKTKDVVSNYEIVRVEFQITITHVN